MDVHRLRSVLDLVIAEHGRLGIDRGLARLLQTLGTCISEPSCDADERFRLSLEELLAALHRSCLNDLVESDRRILAEIQGERLSGDGLAERISAVAEERPFLATRARERLVELADELQRYLGACAAAQASLERLNLGPADAGDGRFELGILLPTELVRGDLEPLLDELREWNQLLRHLLPALGATPAVVELRAFTSRRFDLAARIERDGALAVALLIAGLYGTFRKLRDNRRKVDEFERQSYPADLIGRLRDYEQQLLEQELAALKETLMTRFARREGTKRREVERLLDRGLRFLAARLRAGADIELVPPAADTETLPAAGPDRSVSHHVRLALLAAGGRKDGKDKPEAGAAEAGKGGEQAEEAPRLPLSRLTSDRPAPAEVPSKAA